MTENSTIAEWRSRLKRIDEELFAIADSDVTEPDDVDVSLGETSHIRLTWCWNGEATTASMWEEQHSTHADYCAELDGVVATDKVQSRTYPEKMTITLIYEDL